MGPGRSGWLWVVMPRMGEGGGGQTHELVKESAPPSSVESAEPTMPFRAVADPVISLHTRYKQNQCKSTHAAKMHTETSSDNVTRRVSGPTVRV
jgi:hypothetical protein